MYNGGGLGHTRGTSGAPVGQLWGTPKHPCAELVLALRTQVLDTHGLDTWRSISQVLQ